MRHGSTLVPGLLPDTSNMMTEQVLVMPENSFRQTVLKMFVLIAITFGFVFVFEHFWMLIVLLYLSARFDRTGNTNVEVPTADILVTYAVYRSIIPFAFLPISLGLVIYQAVLFTRHWIYLQTTFPCPPEIAHRIRANLKASLPWSVALLPITLLWGAYHFIENPVRVWQAWVSYLNYGKRGQRIPGAFKSPAGSHSLRVHLFYVTGAAMSLSILNTPLPFLTLPINPAIVLPVAICGPAFLCVVVPSLLLASHLGRIHDEA